VGKSSVVVVLIQYMGEFIVERNHMCVSNVGKGSVVLGLLEYMKELILERRNPTFVNSVGKPSLILVHF
jgi:hypothetical protein